jgi:hypothetical protein
MRTLTSSLDRRAAQLLTDAEFTVWAHIMAAVIGGRDYLARRLREWTLLLVMVAIMTMTPVHMHDHSTAGIVNLVVGGSVKRAALSRSGWRRRVSVRAEGCGGGGGRIRRVRASVS